MIAFEPVARIHVLGLVSISSHGLAFLIGALSCRWLCLRRLSDLEGRVLDNSIPLMVLGSCLGARSFYLLSRPDSWSTPENWVRFWDGGMVSYGGLLGALVALVYSTRRYDICLASFFDRIAPCLLIGWSIGRLGCFLTWYGEEGVRSELPWAVVVEGTGYHPVTLYISVGLLLSGLLLLRSPSDHPFRTSALALLCYSLVRGLSDTWRVYETNDLKLLSQAMAGVLCLTAVSMLLYFRKSS